MAYGRACPDWFSQKAQCISEVLSLKLHWLSYGITGSSRLEGSFKIIESNRQPNAAKPSNKPCP